MHQVLGSTRLGRRRSLFSLDREAFGVPHLPMLRVGATWTDKSDGRGSGGGADASSCGLLRRPGLMRRAALAGRRRCQTDAGLEKWAMCHASRTKETGQWSRRLIGWWRGRMIEVGGAMKRRRAGCRRQAPQRLERVLQRTCMQASTSTHSPTHPFRARTRMKLPIHFLPPAIRAQSGKSLTTEALSHRASPFESPAACVRQSLRP